MILAAPKRQRPLTKVPECFSVMSRDDYVLRYASSRTTCCGCSEPTLSCRICFGCLKIQSDETTRFELETVANAYAERLATTSDGDGSPSLSEP